MSRPKRILAVADFKDDSPKSIRPPRRHWVKGLIRLGHDVQRFSYRDVMLQHSLLPNERFACLFAKRRTDDILLDQVKNYQPDIIFILNMAYLDEKTVGLMRAAVPGVVIVGRDNDPFPELNPARIAIARQTDILIATNAGAFLKTYKDAGVGLCVFIPNPCDPDLHHPYEVEECWKTDIMFAGKIGHSKLEREGDRYDLLFRLAQKPNVRLYGCFGNPPVYGLDYFRAISGARIALSINIANNVRLYQSDRFINNIACGTFTLAKRVPDSDLLFADGVHLKYFDTVEEFFDLADWYLNHEEERRKIAIAGMERAHKEFNCEKIAQYFLDVVEKGHYESPWAGIL